MSPLEQMLRATAAEAAWPETPDLTTAVVERIQARPARGRRRIRVGRPLAVALAALLLLAGSAVAIPAVRNWLGFSTVEIKRVPRPVPAVRGARLGLGTHVSFDTARAKLEFAPAVPPGLGTPTVYYDPFPPGGQLGLVYPRRIVLTQVEGGFVPYIKKFLPPGTGMDRLTIDGQRALWVHGALHQYAYADRRGQIRTDSVRTAGNVLLWRHGHLLLRLEGARSKAGALRIARSARVAP